MACVLWETVKKKNIIFLFLSEIFYNRGKTFEICFSWIYFFIFTVLDFVLRLWAQPEANHSLTVAKDR